MTKFRKNQLYLKILLGLCLSLLAGDLEAQKMFAPVHGYVSIETFEIRKEFVLRLDTVAERLEVDVTAEGGLITTDSRALIEAKLGEWLQGKCPLLVDGKKVSMELDRVRFVRKDSMLGMVVDERETVRADEALLGVVFAASLEGPAKEVMVKWEVFPADGSAAIVSVGTPQNTLTKKVTPSAAQVQWQSKGELKISELLDLPAVPKPKGLRVPLLSILAGLVVDFEAFPKTPRKRIK